MNPGEFLVEGRGLVFGGLKPEDLGQPAGLDYRPVFLGDQRVGRVEEMLVDAVVQDALGLADVVKLVVARVDQAVDQVGGFRHGGECKGLAEGCQRMVASLPCPGISMVIPLVRREVRHSPGADAYG